MDLNDSGALTKNELVHAFSDKELIALMANMHLDDLSGSVLFDMLDRDHSGTITLSEETV